MMQVVEFTVFVSGKGHNSCKLGGKELKLMMNGLNYARVRDFNQVRKRDYGKLTDKLWKTLGRRE